jgi:protein gp37
MTTNIEWVKDADGNMGKTWNPVVGCTRVSPGCQHCYAERMAARLIAIGQAKYQGTLDKNGRWSGVLNRADDKAFNEPLRNKKPTVYFVNSMSDLFHESIPEQWLIDIWNIMRETPRHTYQILTKRADVMMKRVNWLASLGVLPNVWLGVSVESQQYADERIPYLLKTPAAIRFLSCEPLLGGVDLWPWLSNPSLAAMEYGKEPPLLDWVIVGGESGPQARPMHPDWARQIQRQCEAAGVAFFFKQWGEFVGGLGQRINWVSLQSGAYLCGDKNTYEWGDGVVSQRVGKHAAGRLLDGRTWDEMPVVQPTGQLELL